MKRNKYRIVVRTLGRNHWKGSSGEEMVFKRGLSELPKAERKSKYFRAVIEGRIISNYVFRLTKYVCGGCGEVSIVDGNGEWGTRSSLCVLTYLFFPVAASSSSERQVQS
jgi:hypothetical protein